MTINESHNDLSQTWEAINGFPTRFAPVQLMTINGRNYSLKSRLLDDNGQDGNKWLCTITELGNLEYKEFEYSQGGAYITLARSPKHNQEPITVKLANRSMSRTVPMLPRFIPVLSCLVSDAGIASSGESFADFCGNFGYSDDSIKAKAIFDSCRETWSDLLHMGFDMDYMQNQFQDY